MVSSASRPDPWTNNPSAAAKPSQRAGRGLEEAPAIPGSRPRKQSGFRTPKRPGGACRKHTPSLLGMCRKAGSAKAADSAREVMKMIFPPFFALHPAESPRKSPGLAYVNIWQFEDEIFSSTLREYCRPVFSVSIAPPYFSATALMLESPVPAGGSGSPEQVFSKVSM